MNAIADDVFSSLFKHGYVSPFEWKNINKQTTRYTVSFLCAKCELSAIHMFEIKVKEGIHYISTTAIHTFCAIHKVKQEHVLEKVD